MSGICGFFASDGPKPILLSHLARMLDRLREFGEQESYQSVEGRVGIGAQEYPGRITGIAESRAGAASDLLAFHGSLFNKEELFVQTSTGQSLVQQLLELYRADGIGFLSKLRGEYAIALWDGREQTLFLATDRFRVHPLFYYHEGDVLVFASRLRAVTACPLVQDCTVDHEALIHVVASSMIPTPKTVFHEMKKLPPGHLLAFRTGEARVIQYWDLKFSPAERHEKELTEQLRREFADALAVRLRQDRGPRHIGAFLSGGIDSSTVTGVLTQLTNEPVRSFSIGFREERYNEIEYARIAARAFASPHTVYFVTPKDVLDAIPVLQRAFDEPYANASAVPAYYCAKLAREQGVDVLYAGDGGDELFAGNERYATRRMFEYYQYCPAWIRKNLLEPVVSMVAGTTRLSLFVKAQKYINRANVPYPERLAAHGVFEVVPMRDLFDDSFLQRIGPNFNVMEPMFSYYVHAPAWTELDRQLYIDLKLTISDNDVLKVMRTSEAAGVTVRFPFLDHRLAEFATTVPARLKMRGMKLRTFFKRAYADLLPSATRAKRKHGFGLPIPVWLRTDPALNELMHELVLSPHSTHRAIYKRQTLQAIIECHRTDTTSFYGTLLWNIMMIELWFRMCRDRQTF